jgi:IS30 family transposase
MAKTQAKRRTFQRLTIQDRDLIEIRYCIDKRKVSAIAKELERPISTIMRELESKPRVGRGKYSAKVAQEQALGAYAKQGRKRKLDKNEALRDFVITKLKGDGTTGSSWSPEQIAGHVTNCTDLENICPETIYLYIYGNIKREGNGTVKDGYEDLRPCLPRRHTRRQKKGFRKAQKTERREALPSIEDRPLVVLERTEVGHFEGDTMVSRESAARLKTLNELVCGVVFITKTKDGTSIACNQAITERLKVIPSIYRKTLTQDRGTENYDYETVAKELSVSMYFAHPYCSHERGSNENTNGLIRRYLPKGTDFGKITNKRILEIEYQLNTRPRKRLGYLSPYQVYYQKTGIDLEAVTRQRLVAIEVGI